MWLRICESGRTREAYLTLLEFTRIMNTPAVVAVKGGAPREIPSPECIAPDALGELLLAAPTGDQRPVPAAPSVGTTVGESGAGDAPGGSPVGATDDEIGADDAPGRPPAGPDGSETASSCTAPDEGAAVESASAVETVPRRVRPRRDRAPRVAAAAPKWSHRVSVDGRWLRCLVLHHGVERSAVKYWCRGWAYEGDVDNARLRDALANDDAREEEQRTAASLVVDVDDVVVSTAAHALGVAIAVAVDGTDRADGLVIAHPDAHRAMHERRRAIVLFFVAPYVTRWGVVHRRWLVPYSNRASSDVSGSRDLFIIPTRPPRNP